jgi:poly(ADP-ribose) glycohydrolase
MARFRVSQSNRREAARALRGLVGSDPVKALAKARVLCGASDDTLGLIRVLQRDRAWAERYAQVLLPGLLTAAADVLESGREAPPLCAAGTASRVEIPRSESAGWLACMLLGALVQEQEDAPFVDAERLLESTDRPEQAKLQCLLEAFRPEIDGSGHVVIERRVGAPRSAAEWAADATPLGHFDVHDEGVIDDEEGCVQADFANAFLGGGVFHGGCVQEEIRFSVCPELCLGMLVSPRMRDDEAILLQGAARLAESRGYAGELRYVGPHDPWDDRPDVSVLAIDALHFRRRGAPAQWQVEACLREMGKLRAGFGDDCGTFATGNWGCGAFGGDPRLKSLLQWLAASASGWAIRYFTFDDPRTDELAETVAALQGRTVGQLWQSVVRALPAGENGFLKAVRRG